MSFEKTTFAFVTSVADSEEESFEETASEEVSFKETVSEEECDKINVSTMVQQKHQVKQGKIKWIIGIIILLGLILFFTLLDIYILKPGKNHSNDTQDVTNILNITNNTGTSHNGITPIWNDTNMSGLLSPPLIHLNDSLNLDEPAEVVLETAAAIATIAGTIISTITVAHVPETDTSIKIILGNQYGCNTMAYIDRHIYYGDDNTASTPRIQPRQRGDAGSWTYSRCFFCTWTGVSGAIRYELEGLKQGQRRCIDVYWYIFAGAWDNNEIGFGVGLERCSISIEESYLCFYYKEGSSCNKINNLKEDNWKVYDIDDNHYPAIVYDHIPTGPNSNIHSMEISATWTNSLTSELKLDVTPVLKSSTC